MAFRKITPPRVDFEDYCNENEIAILADYIVSLIITELPRNPCGRIAVVLEKFQKEQMTISHLKELQISYLSYKNSFLNDSKKHGNSNVFPPSVVDYVQFHSIAILLEEWLAYLEIQQPVNVISASRIFFNSKYQVFFKESTITNLTQVEQYPSYNLNPNLSGENIVAHSLQNALQDAAMENALEDVQIIDLMKPAISRFIRE